MHVLITGGAGFIGSNLARFLLRQQDAVCVSLNDDSSTGSRRSLDVHFLEEVAREQGIEHVLVSSSISVYGSSPTLPRSDAGFCNRAVEIRGDGNKSKNFTFVDTVCTITHDVLVREVYGPDPDHLDYGTHTTLLDLIALVEGQFGHEVAGRFVDPRAGDMKASRADSSSVHELFPAVRAANKEPGGPTSTLGRISGETDGV